MSNRRVLKGGVVAVGVAVALLTAEAGLRAFIDRLPLPFLTYLHRDLKDRYPQVWSQLRQFAPYLKIREEDADTGWTFKRRMRVRDTNEEGDVYDRTTSDEGFFTPDHAASEASLIVLGDSFLSTFYVPDPIAWVLRDALHQPVYALAVSGWGPEQYRTAYEKFSRTRPQDRVLVFTFVNDITDVQNWNTWKRASSSDSFLTWVQKSNPDNDVINDGAGWADSHLVAWNLIKFSWPPIRRNTSTAGTNGDGETFTGDDGTRFTLRLTRGYPFMVNGPESFFPGGSYYVYLREYFSSLLRLKQSIEAAGSRMVLVWIPAKERVYLPQLPTDRFKTYVTSGTTDIGGLERVMTLFAEQAGLQFLDLTPELVRRAHAGEKLFFTLDGHLNERGNVTVGRLVADFVRQLPSNPPAPRSEGPRLLLGQNAAIERSLPFRAALVHSPLVQSRAETWYVRGRADSQFGYLATWREQTIDKPQVLIMRGLLRKGGFTVGLQKNDSWAVQVNVTQTGPFEAIVPVSETASYSVVIANCLYGNDRDNDFEVAALGWTNPW